MSRYLILTVVLLSRPAAAVSVGDALLLLECGADPSRQAFDVIDGSGGALAFHVRAHGTDAPPLVLDIAGPSNSSGAPLHVWGAYDPPVLNQEFKFDAGTGAFTSPYNGMCVGAGDPDPATGLPSFGAALGIYACNASDPAQRFAVSGLTISSASVTGLCVQAANSTPSCNSAPFSSYPYCNASLSVEARVADLLSRMRPSEKAAALDSGVPAIARLGVPSMHSGEALHGAATGCLGAPWPGSTGCPTSFPAPVALGAAFDEQLWLDVGLAIGTEARALYNENTGAAWVFAPNINLARDPRWGRNQEVPGEDPALVSAYGAAFVRGVQGEGGADPARLLAATTLKHWVAYDFEGFIPRTDPLPRPVSSTCDTPSGCQRWNFDALVNDRDLMGYYAAPFLASVEAGARSIMCAYNAVRQAPACGSPLLNSMLRDALDWDGHVVSDCTAIELMGDAKYDNCKPPYPPVSCKPDSFPGHNFTVGPVETAQAAFKAGTDVNCGPFYEMWLAGLVANGSIAQADVDLAVTRVYRTAVKLGLLDPSAGRPYAQLNASAVDTPAHRALAQLAAAESLVLLKNDGDGAGGSPLLPLRGGGAGLKIAFLGPHANSTQALLSN